MCSSILCRCLNSEPVRFDGLDSDRSLGVSEFSICPACKRQCSSLDPVSIRPRTAYSIAIAAQEARGTIGTMDSKHS